MNRLLGKARAARLRKGALRACGQVGACAALGAAERVVLPGYGVEAVLKNTEYR